MKQMGMGLPDNRREADSSYCAKALEAWSWWVPHRKPPPSKSSVGDLPLQVKEAAMNSFWQRLTVVFGEVSFVWTVLFVICIASILAFVFDASTDAIFPIFTVGFLAGIAEHVVHRRNNP
jgi:hypothetical protein